MFQEYFYADEDEHHAAGDLRLVFIAGAETMSDGHADERKNECRDADQRYRKNDIGLQESKGHAYRQRVDTGGDGQQEQLADG